jgi:hypothetical protein
MTTGNMDIWPRRGFPITISDVTDTIAEKIVEEIERMSQVAREDPKLAGPDMVGMISEIEKRIADEKMMI